MLSTTKSREPTGTPRVLFADMSFFMAMEENLALGPGVSYHCTHCGKEGGKLEKETGVNCWNCGTPVP